MNEHEQRPWKCERCSAGDNATRFRNPWDVSVTGERGAGVDDMPELGEDYYDTQHCVELCDRCAKRDDTPAWLLAFALRGELAKRNAERAPALTLEETCCLALLEGCAFGRRGT